MELIITLRLLSLKERRTLARIMISYKHINLLWEITATFFIVKKSYLIDDYGDSCEIFVSSDREAERILEMMNEIKGGDHDFQKTIIQTKYPQYEFLLENHESRIVMVRILKYEKTDNYIVVREGYLDNENNPD